MSEILTVEVAGKFGPKCNEKWYGVKRPLKASDFENGKSYEVDLEEWKEGRFNIVKAKEVTEKSPPKAKETAKKQQKVAKDSNDDKNQRILVQGITQAAMTCPSLAGLPFTNVEELKANIQELADEMIEYVEGKI